MFARLVPALVEVMGAAYPELGRAQPLIVETLKLEETRFKEMLAEVPDSFRRQMAGRVPQKRIGTPEEAAAVAAFLLSDDASHVTAQSLAVDGGLLGTLMIET